MNAWLRLPAEVWLDAAGLARRILVSSEPAAAADAQVWSIVELWDFGVAVDITPPGPEAVLAPADAYRLLRQSISCPDPVVFLEPKRRYWSKETAVLTPEGPPIDRAVVRRPGRDVTLIAYGGMVSTALEAAEAAVEEDWDVEVIDLRSLSPFDDQTLTESVRRTGRAVIVHEASGFAGYGAEVAARLTEQCFHYLEAPILRVTGLDIPYPPPHLERFHLPNTDRILGAIARLQWEEGDA